MVNKNRNNIVYETLLAKLKELEHNERELDEAYTTDKRDIINKKLQIRTHLNTLDEKPELIRELSKKGRKPVDYNSFVIYPYKESLFARIVYAIRDLGRFVHNKEICAYIMNKEPNEHNEQELSDKIGRYVYKLKNSRKIVSHQVGTSLRNIFYGLPEWINDEGSVKIHFIYKQEALMDKAVIRNTLTKVS